MSYVDIILSPLVSSVRFVITVGCRYNAVQYNTIFYTALRWRKQKMNHSVKSQNTPHISPYWASYRCICEDSAENRTRYNGAVLQFDKLFYQKQMIFIENV